MSKNNFVCAEEIEQTEINDGKTVTSQHHQHITIIIILTIIIIFMFVIPMHPTQSIVTCVDVDVVVSFQAANNKHYKIIVSSDTDGLSTILGHSGFQ